MQPAENPITPNQSPHATLGPMSLCVSIIGVDEDPYSNDALQWLLDEFEIAKIEEWDEV